MFGGTLATHSTPLQTPPPFYDATSDCVKAFVRVRFGPHAWELPNEAFPMTFSTGKDKNQLGESLRHFARLLLEGSVFADLKPFRPFLKFKPTAFNSTMSIPPKAVKILQALKRHNMSSKKQLQDAWFVLCLFPQHQRKLSTLIFSQAL